MIQQQISGSGYVRLKQDQYQKNKDLYQILKEEILIMFKVIYKDNVCVVAATKKVLDNKI